MATGTLVGLQAGYLKALERGNSVPRLKGFCEADKVNCFAVLLQNIKCCNLRIIHTSIFYENILFNFIFGEL